MTAPPRLLSRCSSAASRAVGAAFATAALCAGLTVLRRTLIAVTVRGRSMEPTYHDGDRVLVRRDRPPRRGQAVVVEQPAVSPSLGGAWDRPPLRGTARAPAVSARSWVIKRLVAVPGDSIPRDRVPALAGVSEGCVPPGKLVLLGDNPANSYDSRRAGYFPAERILGVVVRRMHVARGRPRLPGTRPS
jgi:signal peptidase I